jgi:hypothetical protein
MADIVKVAVATAKVIVMAIMIAEPAETIAKVVHIARVAIMNMAVVASPVAVVAEGIMLV